MILSGSPFLQVQVTAKEIFAPEALKGVRGNRHGLHSLALKGKKVNMEIKMVNDMVVLLGEK